MEKRFLLVFSIFLFLVVVFADQYPYSFSYSGTSGPLDASGTFYWTLDVVHSGNPAPGSYTTVTISLVPGYHYSSSHVECVRSLGDSPLASPGNKDVPLTFLPQSDFNNIVDKYNNCGYYDDCIGSGMIRCVDVGSTPLVCGCTGGGIPENDIYLTETTYHNPYATTTGCTDYTETKASRVAAGCKGSVYINNKYVGELTDISPSISYNLYIPSSSSDSYSVSIRFEGECLVAAQQAFSNGNPWATFIYSPSSYSQFVIYSISLCKQLSARLDAPSTITVNANGDAGNVQLTITNTGEVTFDVQSITVNNGCSFNAQFLPSNIAPGSSTTITGTLDCPSNPPTAVTFTASVHSNDPNACSSDDQVSDTSYIIQDCDNLQGSLSATNPIVVDPGGHALNLVSLTITNTGNVQFVANNLQTSNGCSLTLPPNTLPISVNPSESKTISGDFSCPSANIPSSVTFSIDTSINSNNACGGITKKTFTTTSLITIKKIYLRGRIISASPDPFPLSEGIGTTTLTIENNGDVPSNITNITDIDPEFDVIFWSCPSTEFAVGEIKDCTVTVKWVGKGQPPDNGSINFTAFFTTTYPVSNSPSISSEPYSVNYVRICGNLDFDAFFYPTPVAFKRTNQAKLNITIANLGTLPINITTIVGDSAVSFEPQHPYIIIQPGTFATVEGTATLLQETFPQSFTISITAHAIGETCDGIYDSTKQYIISVKQAGDIVPIITTNSSSYLKPGEIAGVNVSVVNQGNDDVDDSLLNVSVKYCKSASSCDLIWTSTRYGDFWIRALNPGDEETEIISPISEGGYFDISCDDAIAKGYSRILVIAAANNDSNYAIESNYDNNIEKMRFYCMKYKCEVTGPDEIYHEGDKANYQIKCYDGKGEVDCTTIGINVDWSAYSLNNYLVFNLYPTGSINENAIVEMINIYADDWLVVGAKLYLAPPWDGTVITCSPKQTQVFHEVCEDVI